MSENIPAAPETAAPVTEAAKPSFFIRNRNKLIAGTAALALVIGGASFALASNPSVKLIRAMGATFGSGNLDVTTSIQVTSEYIEATGFVVDETLPGIQSPADAAAAINQAKLRVISLDSELPKFGIEVTYGDADLLGLYMIEKKMYFWSDISDLPNQRPAIVEQNSIDEIVPVVEFLFGGEDWISSLLGGQPMMVDFAANPDLNKVYDENLAPSLNSASSENQSQISGELVNALRDSVSVEADGSDDIGERMLLKIDGDKFGPASQNLFADAAAGLNASKADIEKAKKQWVNGLKGKELNARIWLKDGKVARIQVDLANFVESSEFEPWAVVVQMDFQEPVLEAPTNAFDLTEQAAALINFGLLDSF